MSLEYNTSVETGQEAIGDFFDSDRFDWTGKRHQCGKIARRYEIGGDVTRANKVAGCATALDFGVDDNAKRVLVAANFCQLRLCPMCLARRARKNSLRLSRVMNKVEAENPGIRYVFLTLTERNCSAEQLQGELKHFTKGWERLRHMRQIRRSIKGWFRALEITHTYKYGAAGEYHPHLHCILAVDGDKYFHGDEYITHRELVLWWRQSMRLDYDPTVHIQTTRDKKGRRRGESAAKEAAKYVVKESQIFNAPDISEESRILMDYTKALDRKRLMAFGGIMKEAARALDIDMEKEGDDLVHLDEEKCRADVFRLIECYRWDFLRGEFVLTDTYEPGGRGGGESDA